MNSYLKKLSLVLAVIFVFVTSAVKTIPAYADDETPPQDVSTAETVETPDQDSEGEEATPLSTPEPASESILTQLPEGTNLVILDEQGITVPLATKEAAEAIAASDPIWCPVAVVPTPGMNGCTQSFGQFITGNPLTGLFDYLLANQPGMDGVIWVEKTYNGQDNANIIFDGATTFTGMADFALTINGGWDTATNTLDLNAPSTFDVSLRIVNWHNAVTINNILVTGVSGTDGIAVSASGNITLDNVQSNANAGDGAELASSAGTVTVKNSQFDGNLNQYGLVVNNTLGDITLNSVTANANNNSGIYLTTPANINLTNIQAANNGASGASLNNSSGTGNINITSAQFTGNSSGLYILSAGSITLKDIISSGNPGGGGAYLDNLSAATPKTVTLNGINIFSNNGGTGLTANSLGAITINNITAGKNGNYGVFLNNNNPSASGAVTLTGFNVFSENNADGLVVFSNGAIKLNNIVTVSNAGNGVNLDNDTALTPQPVLLTGVIMAKYNAGAGLYIRSSGAVTAGNLTANYNYMGADIDNSAGGTLSSIILSGASSFSNNQTHGLSLASSGLISLSNITANENGTGAVYGDGATINNSAASSPKDIVISGTNSFNDNFSNGLSVFTHGGITINNLNANGNGNVSGGAGVTLSNLDTPSVIKPIKITGINSTSNNRETGLSIQTYGAVTIASLMASNNGLNATSGDGYGLRINNSFGTVASAVTLTGTNVLNNNYETNLYIYSRGQVTLNAITANNSVTGNGLLIDNQAGKLGVKMTGTNTFNGNQLSNLSIQSRGLIAINSVSANNSVNGYGIFLQNTNALTPASITISGVSHASGNWLTGVKVDSLGQISINNLTALNNGLGSVNGEDYGVVLTNSAAPSPAMVILSGTNNISGNHESNLVINTKGNITINNLTAKDSTNGYGAYLWNSLPGTVVNITLSGVNVLSGNNMDNLYIQTLGSVSLSNITADNSITGYGTYISNSAAVTPKAITIGGVNSFSSNQIDGLNIESASAVTLSNITANGNGSAGTGRGAVIFNGYGTILSSVTLNGYGIFNNNQEDGVRIQSKGDITLNNLTATGNGMRGAWLTNNTTGKGITIKGQNIFNNNGYNGLEITSSGAVLLNNITANSNLNNGVGAHIDNAHDNFLKPVTLNGQNTFNGNSAAGLVIISFGAVTTNNINASNTVGAGIFGYSGAYIENNFGSTSPNVTMNGLNVFNSNGSAGLGLFSKGSITISNITAQFNGQMTSGGGVVIDNTSSTSFAPITLAGKNNFSGNNGSGLSISSDGSIVTNNITANDNVQSGAVLGNLTAGTVTPKPVTMLGFNQFNNNGAWGLSVISNGVITTNNLTANFNDAAGFTGVTLNNSAAVKAAAIMVQGVNTFNGNHYAGLAAYSIGSITLSNINVSGTISNSSSAVILDNHNGASSASVTVTGANISGNNRDGLDIWSNGVVNVTKLTADDNDGLGLHVITNGNVNVMCASLTNNTTYGWAIDIPSPAIATLKGVISVGNGTSDEFFPNTGGLVKSINCPLP